MKCFEHLLRFLKENDGIVSFLHWEVEREPTEEIDLLDTMLSSLVDLLIKKGIITEEEYEKRIKDKIKIDKNKEKIARAKNARSVPVTT